MSTQAWTFWPVMFTVSSSVWVHCRLSRLVQPPFCKFSGQHWILSPNYPAHHNIFEFAKSSCGHSLVLPIRRYSAFSQLGHRATTEPYVLFWSPLWPSEKSRKHDVMTHVCVSSLSLCGSCATWGQALQASRHESKPSLDADALKHHVMQQSHDAWRETVLVYLSNPSIPPDWCGI